jgi:ABC-type branched-subunit amino acid transport system permease subunit
VLRYNMLFILAEALVMVGAYALTRQLVRGRLGAAVAAVRSRSHRGGSPRPDTCRFLSTGA